MPGDDRTGEPITRVDEMLAEHLGAGGDSGSLRDKLALDDPSAHDLSRRLDALEFVDSFAGSLDVPERIGDYRITRLLGRGGMGTVYAAFQETLEREVALKVLAPGLSADPAMRQRFRIEARATAALHHQHIVPVYDFGEVRGLLYFAMEKIDGVGLDAHIARARRAARPLYECRDAARRFAGVADALAHAHKRRILHRDIKPANLLVHGDGTLALADFGLSKVLGEASVRTTGRGGFLGTLQYASPEQSRGERLTPASDLYSLGVTIFEAVTGQLPYRVDTPEALLDAILNHDARGLRTVRPDVPVDLAVVVEKLLQKRATDRYVDGEQVARDLRRVAEGEPILVRRQAWVMRAWRRVRRRPGLSAAVAASIVLGVASIVAIAARVAERSRAQDAYYAELLGTAVRTVADEPGPPAGPLGLAAVLTGVERSDGSLDGRVRGAFEAAQALAPDDPRAPNLLAAYEQDPAPNVGEMLVAGRGLQARRVLDEMIEHSVRQLATSEPADSIRLYHLFLARAVACLTASVADPGQARADLQVASMFRPGATFPRILALLADLALGRDPALVVQGLDERVRLGGNAGQQLIADLLVAGAARLRPRPAHLMSIDLRAGLRRQILELARGRGASDALPADGARWTGIEGEIAAWAREAATTAQGNQPRLAELDGKGRRLLDDEVHPLSPLQSWRFVFEMLLRRELANPGDLDAEARLGACLDLLDLDPPLELIAAVERLLYDAARSGSSRALELRARVRLRLDPKAATAAVDAWIASESDHSDAYLARFECQVAQGRPTDAGDAATIAIQLADDPQRVVAQVVARLRAVEAVEVPEFVAPWTRLRGLFERAY